MISGFPYNSCVNGVCGNCVAQRLEQTGFIQKASDHCKCAAEGHSDNIVSKKLPNKAVFSKQKDDYTPPVEIKMVDESNDV